MIDCKSVIKNLFEYMDKELDKKGCEDMESHIDLCRKCYDRIEFEKELRNKMKSCTGESKAPSCLIERIKCLLDKFEK